MKRTDGFSLKELLVVLFIISAMIAGSIPLFFKLRAGFETRQVEAQKNLTTPVEQNN